MIICLKRLLLLAILVLTSLSCESTEDTLPTPHTVEYMVKLSEPYASSIAYRDSYNLLLSPTVPLSGLTAWSTVVEVPNDEFTAYLRLRTHSPAGGTPYEVKIFVDGIVRQASIGNASGNATIEVVFDLKDL